MSAFMAAYYFFILPRIAPQAPPAGSPTHLAQAQQLEAEGRDAKRARGERVDRLKKAVEAWERVYQEAPKTPQGVQARFNEINIYDYLATLEGKTAGTYWYDQAEIRLKEMEKDFLGRTGTVQLESNGAVRPEAGDFGKIASARLNQIREARDAYNRRDWTWQTIDFLVRLTGAKPDFSYFFALTLIVVVLKGLTFPFQRKQYQYQRDMMRIQPLIKDIQEKMKGRPAEEVNRRMMQVYKDENVNIASGCLPMLVMMFALLPVFWMVRAYEFQFTKATFLWIGTPYSKTPEGWWLADNLAQFDYPLFAIYLLSTVFYSLMQPKPADPQQAQQQRMMLYMMPLMFGFFMWQGQWSSAFMLYWFILNLVSMWQSWKLNKEFGTGGGGGTAVGAVAPPAEPLEPMKGTQGKPPGNGRNGRGNPRVPGRVQPRRSGRRG